MTSELRTVVPTAALWDGYQTAAQKRARMISMGLHVFYPEWQGSGRVLSSSFREVTLKIYGKSEQITFPCQVCTKVEDVKQALASALTIDVDSLKFLVKQGCSTRQLLDLDEMRSIVTVRGIASFKRVPFKWPHPTAIIGAGYHGLKTCMMYLKSGNSDIICFDRNTRVGGYCWITAANKCSKLQTEFAAFHVWWGQDMMQGRCGFPDESWGTWPGKDKVLEHFQVAAEEYGILPHVRFHCNVSEISVVGDAKNNRDTLVNPASRYYNLSVSDVAPGQDGAHGSRRATTGQPSNVTCSVLWSYPGSMTKNRIIEYPGEESFEGHVGYGMNDDAPYQSFPGSRVAILGNGAFAVENARTSIELGAEKVFIVTRRKNLASPRLPCWFVHQGPAPTPGSMVLRMFEPMYRLCNFGDPWEFWSVNASADRQRVQIIQNSRFGIGDVTFLAVACGMVEYIVDTLKRCTKHTLHLDSGLKLENVSVLLKCLGLLGDFEVDQMHNMTEVIGFWASGDWRRPIYLDATGMNAANFTTFSTGIGTTGYVRLNKFLFDNPQEYLALEKEGILQALPKNQAKEKEEKPAYVYDVNHTNTSFVIMGAMCPKAAELSASDSEYKYNLYHVSHPLDKTIRECREDWDRYQETWKKQGCKAEYVPYPYTREMIEGYFTEYNRLVGLSIAPEGPPKDAIVLSQTAAQRSTLGALPAWARDDRAIEAAEAQVKANSSQWWRSHCDSVVEPASTAKPRLH